MGLGAGKWHIIRTIVLPCSIDGIVTGCILAVGTHRGRKRRAAVHRRCGRGDRQERVFKAYTSNGATLSVLLYLRAFEDGDFTSAWGIGAVLLVLVLLINLAARLAKNETETEAVKIKRYSMENTNVPVISAKDLNLWYGDFKALKSISLDVGEREITALIGPSGCGKSTF